MKNLQKQARHSKLLFMGFIVAAIFIVPGCGGLQHNTKYEVGAWVKLNSDILIGPG